MSDRVRFLTRNDLGTPVLSSGCTGWPFPQFAGSTNPLTVSRATMHDWFWRVDTWDVAVSADIHTYRTGYPDEVTPVSFNFTTVRKIGRLTESDLVLASGALNSDIQTAIGSGLVDYIDAGGTPQTTAWSWLMQFQMFHQYYIEAAGNYSPSFTCVAQFSTTAFAPTINEVESLGGTGPDNVGSVTFDGHTATMYGFIGGTGATNPDIWVESVDIDITRNSYFPYAAQDASPIYDTTTGATLQSPLN